MKLTSKSDHQSNGDFASNYIEVLFSEDSRVQLLIDRKSGRIEKASSGAVRFYGYPKEQLTRMKIQDINQLPAEDVEARMRDVECRKQSHFEFRHRTSTGCIRDVRVASIPVVYQGREYLLSLIDDITAEKEQNNKVNEYYELLEIIINSSSNLLFLINREVDVVQTNFKAKMTLGGNAQEDSHKLGEILKCVNHTASETGCGNTPSCVGCPLRMLVMEVYNATPQIKDRIISFSLLWDGRLQERIFQAGASLIYYKGDLLVLLSLQDITEERNYQDNLRIMEQKWAEALRASAEGVWDWDFLKNDLYLTDNLISMIHLPADQPRISRADYEKLIHPDDVRKVIAALNQHISGISNNYLQKYRLKTPAGYIWVLDRGKVIEYDANKSPSRMIGTLYDITAEKKTAIALRESKSRLQSILESVREAIVEYNEAGLVLHCNSSAQQLFGLRPDDTSTAMNIDKITLLNENGLRCADEDNPLRKVFSIKEGNIKTTVGYVSASNEMIWLRLNITLISNGEKKYVASFDNITEEKNSQAQLERLNSTKDKLFSILAHDLVNPFHALMTLSVSIEDSLREGDHNTAITFAGHLAKSSKAAYNLMTNLLSWSRLQRGIIKPELVDVKLQELFEELEEEFKSILKNKQIALVWNIENDAMLHTDRQMLATILRNLISNAIKFSYPGTSVKLEYEKTENHHQINVIDHGVGMSKNEVRRFFDRSSFESTDGTHNEQGAGIGLSICKEFTELLGGKLQAHSLEGEGSTFEIIF